MTAAKYSIHPTGGYAVLADDEMRRVDGSEAGVGFTVRTSRHYLAGYGWAIVVSVDGVNNNAPIKTVYDDDIAAGMARGEEIGRQLAGEWAREWAGDEAE